MDHYELGVALAVAHLAELHRQADRRRLASRIPGRTTRRHRDRTPGSPLPAGREDQAVDRAASSRAASGGAFGGVDRRAGDVGEPDGYCWVGLYEVTDREIAVLGWCLPASPLRPSVTAAGTQAVADHLAL